MHRADNLTTFMCQLSWNLRTSSCWNPLGLSMPVMGLLYLFFFFLQLLLTKKYTNLVLAKCFTNQSLQEYLGPIPNIVFLNYKHLMYLCNFLHIYFTMHGSKTVNFRYCCWIAPKYYTLWSWLHAVESFLRS